MECCRRKINHNAFDSFKALCNEKKTPCKLLISIRVGTVKYFVCCNYPIILLHFVCIAYQKENVYECADCKYQTPRKADLKKHLKRHMGVCDYCCNYCTRKFFDKYNLERHINANHTKKQQYFCRTVILF